ncbi:MULTISPECIES: tetratricopeptide repeat protein [Cohnella]|uniref:tetratricopeptide repeat protein n=1 Tax=Cohnella TaxID=329857 RepID=UPI0009BBFB1E|nr:MULTISPECIES: tetratricopeptide repeat protein [Cohnella]MBN2984281.1 tetratricopeptide repeat protein [Cohnella algarum]
MNGESCVGQAYEAILRGDFEAAAAWFLRAVELEPDNASYHYKASVTLSRSGKLDVAIRHAKRAAELDPEATVYLYYVQTLEARQLTSEAKALLERQPPATELAIGLLNDATRLDPLDAESFLLLGIAYRLQGDLERSLQALQETLQLHPQHEEAKKWLDLVKAERRRNLKLTYFRNHRKRDR